MLAINEHPAYTSRVLVCFVPCVEVQSLLLTNWSSFVHNFGKELLRL